MAVKTWQASAGVLSGNWSDAAHWTGGTLPANGDDVTLPALTGAYTVTLDTNTANLNSLALSSANATLAVGTNTVTISGNSASNAINLTGGGKITIAGGTISDSGGFNTGTNGTVTGKGFLTAGSYSGTGTLTASGGTLDVIGNIAVSTVKLAVANVAGSDLKIDGNSTVVQAAAVSISNANQTLEVASGSSLQVNAAQTVTNGTLKIDGTFTDAAGITLSNGTISGAGTVTATTGITGKGTVSLGLSTGNTVTASGGTLDLTGTIATGSGAPTLLIATAANSDLKIDSVATIAPVSITNANQTLEIGTGKSVTVTAPQNVTLGKILLDSGSTLTDASGITFGANGSANNGFLSGIGSVAADLSLAAGSTSTGSTITATGGGTLDLTGGIDTSLVLAISTTGTNTLKLDHDVTIQPVAISSSKQILEIGAGHSVAINAAQNVTGGTIKLNSGATLTDSNGITFGTNATATNGFLSGIGTVAANLSRATGSTSTGSKITALGGGTLDLTGTIGANLGLVIDSTAPNTLKIDSDSSVGAVTISSANQTLQIGTGHSVTISAAQTVTTGTLQVDGVLTDTAGITLASNGTLSGSGSVSSTTAIKGSGSLSLGLSTANTVTASGGTLDITGTIATGAGAPTLAIANTAGSVLKIDTDAAINAVTVTTANEKLQIGAGHNVTISGAQTISTGTLQVDGSLTDSNGITLTGATLSGAGSVSATTNVTGTGTISLGLSTANTVTASGGTLDITGAVGTLTAPTLAVATVAGSILKIDSDATIGAVSISSANQTLQIGSGHAVTIGATQTVASGKLQVDGTLTDTAGITLSGGTLSGSGSVSNTTNITGSGTISLNLSSTSNRVTASGGTLAVTGALTNVTALAVADVANSDLKIDSNATIGPVAIDASNKTLEVAAGRTVTIGAAQTVSLGKIQIDSGATLADAGGITLGSGSNNGFLQGLGTVTANLVRGDVSTGSTVTAVGGGTLDLQGTIDSALVLGISSAAANTLKIDSDSTIGAVSISSTNQTLQIGAGHSVTIGAAQTVTSGTLRIDGTVTDVSGITLSAGTLSGAGSVSGSTAITGKGTVSLGLSTANTVTASGGTLDLTGAIATGASAPLLAIATASASDLKIDSDVTIASVVINNANQTLEIGAGHSVTINAAQNITLGKILLDSGSTLTNSAGITFGTSGSASSGFLTGIGTVAANLSRATGSTSAGSTITAQGGGTLDLTGSIDSTLALAISTAAINTLKLDHDATIKPITISNAKQTLEIGAGRSVTINAAQTVSVGKLLLEAGATLADSAGIILGNGTNDGFLQGVGTVTANLTHGGSGAASTITAQAGGTLDLQGSVSTGLTLAIDTAAANTLKIDGTAITANAIAISSASQTLEIGVAGNLTINAAESITNGSIQLDGGSLSDSSGLTVGLSATLTGKGTLATDSHFEGSGTVVASGGRLEFQDVVDATSTSTFNIGSAATLAFESTVGTSTLHPSVSFTGASASVLDLSGTTLGNFHGIVAGFAANEGIRMPSAAVSFTQSFDGTNTTVTAHSSGGGSVGTITLSGDYSSTYFHIQNGGALAGDMVVCFMPGTLIRTPDGERAVEAFRASDLVLTMDDRVVPVRWVGRQTVSRIFGDPLRVLPIRIKAGALGSNLPRRDLLLSPDHAVLIDDVLVQAGALVNGRSIERERDVPTTYTYYHLELDDHSLIFAEDVPAETFVDNIDRLRFDNWDEHEALYPGGKPIVEMPYPRVKSYRQLPRSIRSRLFDDSLGRQIDWPCGLPVVQSMPREPSTTSRTGVSGVRPPRRAANVSAPLFSQPPATARCA